MKPGTKSPLLFGWSWKWWIGLVDHAFYLRRQYSRPRWDRWSQVLRDPWCLYVQWGGMKAEISREIFERKVREKLIKFPASWSARDRRWSFSSSAYLKRCGEMNESGERWSSRTSESLLCLWSIAKYIGREVRKKNSRSIRKDPREQFSVGFFGFRLGGTARASVVNLDLEHDAHLGDGVSGIGMYQNGWVKRLSKEREE